jgi:hypothetical protein
MFEVFKQNFDSKNKINEKQSSSSPTTEDELTYNTHSQAIYTSRLLNFKNLLEPKNEKNYHIQVIKIIY